MPRPRPVRLAAVLVGLFALAAVVAAVPAGAPVDGGDLRQVATTYPTNAGKVFRWGDSQWHDGFVTGPELWSAWSVNRPALVRNQHGMLTINATETSGTVAATLTGHGRQYGRWEARVRAEQYRADLTPYHVVWELVPTAASGYHCGARSIVLADYALGTGRAHLYLRNLPDVQYTASKALALGPGPFHTYAVEVTPDHISWFVDTHVLRTIRADDVHTGARYKVRFRLLGTDGARMNPGRMQMDWVRYYTLDRPNAQSIEAPEPARGTYDGGC